MPFNEAQQMSLAIWPKVSGTTSMLGSSLIIYDILRDKSKRQKVFHRLLLGMSLIDVCVSFWLFLSTWPIPAETENVFAPKGDQMTCSAQGFFVQLGVATPLYNAGLALYYLLVVRYKWTEQDLKKAEKYFQGIPFIWAIGTAITGSFLRIYNNANLWCWISSVPNASTYRFAFYYIPVYACLVFAMVAMFLTWDEVRKMERTALGASGSHSREVAHQACFFLIAFYCALFPAALTRFLQTFGITYYPLILLMSMTLPGQGVLNYLVYSRPKWIAYRKKHPEWSIWKSMALLCRGKGTRRRGSSSDQDDNDKDKEESESDTGDCTIVMQQARQEMETMKGVQNVLATQVESKITRMSVLEEMIKDKLESLQNKEDAMSEATIKMVQMTNKCMDKMASLEKFMNDAIKEGKKLEEDSTLQPLHSASLIKEGSTIEDFASALQLSTAEVAEDGEMTAQRRSPEFRIEMVDGTNTFRIVMVNEESTPANSK